MSPATVLHLDGLRVPVETGGSSRKAKLTIESDGSLRLRVAADVATEELTRFLVSKRDWVYRKLAEKEAFEYEPTSKELVDGEAFSYLGRNYRLKLAETDGGVRLTRGRLVLPVSETAAGETAIIGWYRRRGEVWLRPRVRAWADRLRVAPGRLEVADLGHKWGSATAGQRVRIHWASLQLPPALIDYIIVHELAHLHEPHHGPTFWQLVARVMPDYEERKGQLARSGAGLWFGTVS